MNAFLRLIILSVLPFVIQAQSLEVVKEYDSHYYEINGLEVNLSPDKITITAGSKEVYIENLSGKKILRSSPAGNYFLIANHHFSNEKIDYPIEIRVFERNGDMVFPFRFLAPFDLPHHIFNINDFGILTAFDPMTLKITLVGDEIFKEVELEKEAPFEMEKAAFTEITEDFVFVLTSQKALDITEEANNATLYRINLNDLTINRKILDYNTPTLLQVFGGNVFVSGVKFENLKPIGKTLKYDLELNQLASNDIIIEKLVVVGDKVYAKYFNMVYELSSNLSVLNQRQFSHAERIFDLTVFNKNLLVLTVKSEKNILYRILPDMSIVFEVRLNIFGISKLDNLHVSKGFLIAQIDSKSVKLKLTEK